MTPILIILAEFVGFFGIDVSKQVVHFRPAAEIPHVIDDPIRGKRKADAYCEYSTKHIIVNLDHWKTINKWQKKELIFHELGHCVCGLWHIQGEDIMNPFSPTGYQVKSDGSNWRKMVTKMVKRCKPGKSSIGGLKASEAS